MIAGNLRSGDEERLPQHFAANGWEFFGPGWLREQLRKTAASGYSNQVSAIVAKLLLRDKTGASSGAADVSVRNRPASWPKDAPLKLLVDYNPKQPGSKSYDRFQGYFSPQATTLAGALSVGVRMDDIRNDVGKGYISLG
jgi:hypothetical protein